MSRPTKYEKEFADRAYQYSLMGATDIEIAESLGAAECTLYEWKKKYPEFAQAIKRGKMPADSEVACALFKRAKGHEGPDGKYYPPDTTAAIFWLKNRQKDKWRDKHDVEHSGDVAVTMVDYSSLHKPSK